MKTISPEQLFTDNCVQVDHIIPFSRSADDGYNNKILVFADENQKKGNKTPFEYMGNTPNWEIYSKWVEYTYRYNHRDLTPLQALMYYSGKCYINWLGELVILEEN